ncbi:DUF6221 family protein [Streptomyces sp. C10-9-1]|uniref:DUF6221 family protein n=1 Tax=Streptomyces sp. C10-9-1 TaxID=1859285 RepID=UPI003F4A641F
MSSTGKAPAPDLVAFLRARLDEDEQAARAATPGPWRWRQEHGEPWEPAEGGWLDYSGEYIAGADDRATLFGPGMTPHADAVHIARHDPARALRDVEAARVVIEQYENLLYNVMPDDNTGIQAVEQILRAKAATYDGHPDYREGRRP